MKFIIKNSLVGIGIFLIMHVVLIRPIGVFFFFFVKNPFISIYISGHKLIYFILCSFVFLPIYLIVGFFSQKIFYFKYFVNTSLIVFFVCEIILIISWYFINITTEIGDQLAEIYVLIVNSPIAWAINGVNPSDKKSLITSLFFISPPVGFSAGIFICDKLFKPKK